MTNKKSPAAGRQPGENHQVVIYDSGGSVIFEIHFDNEILGGFDYICQEHLSARECQALIKEIYYRQLI